jgi:ferric-dicitrate binding protein FerR (iron transport regulator)
MNPLTCAQAEEQLELFALDECPEPLHSAIAAHLETCPTCRRSLSDARQLVGLLDLQHQEQDRLRRLFERLDTENRFRPLRNRVLHFPRRLAALAALLLLAFGLSWLTPPRAEPQFELFAGLEAEARKVPAVQGVFVKGDPLRATIRTSSHHPEQPIVSEGVNLTAGTLEVQVFPGRGPFEVRTPWGTLTSAGGNFAIEARPSAVVVNVREGSAALSNARGRVAGGPGDVLVAASREAPHRYRGTGP